MNHDRYQLTLESPRPAGDPANPRELKGLLKALLRRYGWRCVAVAPDGGGVVRPEQTNHPAATDASALGDTHRARHGSRPAPIERDPLP